MELNLDIIDLILLEITLFGYPFFKKILMIFLIFASILLLEQIISAQRVKHFTKLIFLDYGTKESQLVYKSVKVGLQYTFIVKEERPFLTNMSRKGNILSFSSSIG